MKTLTVILSSLLLSFLAVLLPLLFRSLRRKAKINLPPGPPALPFLGNLHQLENLSSQYLFQLSRKFGPLMLLKLGTTNLLVVSSAEQAAEILKTNDVLFCSRPFGSFARRFSFGYGVVFGSYGESWRHLRKISTLELYTSKRIQSSRLVREEEVRVLLKNISDLSAAGRPVNIYDAAVSLFSSIMYRLAFGKRSDNHSELKVQLREGVYLMGAFFPSDVFPYLGFLDRLTGFQGRLEKCFRFFNTLLDEEIEAHRKCMKEEDEDLMSVLLRAGLSREEIKSVLVEVLLGGSDTSSSFIESAMLELILNPRVMRKAQEEGIRVVGKKPYVEESDLAELVYLKSTVKEVLRRRPPAPMLLPHESTKEVRISGYDIPAKTIVLVNARAIMTDSSLWKDAEDFRPERFVDSNFQYQGQDFRYLPFSSGRRICPGANLAIASTELALANLLHSFDWSLPDGVDPQDFDTREASGTVLRLENPLLLRATTRHG